MTTPHRYHPPWVTRGSQWAPQGPQETRTNPHPTPTTPTQTQTGEPNP